MLVDVLNDKNMSVFKKKVGEIDGIAQRLEKIASLPIEDRDNLTKEAFAWPDEKLFPIYSPEHALISSVYLEGNEDVPYFVKQACEEACALFGFDVKIDSLEKVAEEPEQLEAEDFLLPAQRKLPVVDADTMRMSKSALEKVASMLPIEDLVVANRQLVKKAEELGESVSDKTLSLGLYGTIDTTTARSILHDRKLMTGDDRYEKIASDMKGDTIYSVNKVADIVFDVVHLDKENNFEKTASETILELVTPGVVDNVFQIGEEEIPTEKIASIDAEDWLDIFPRSTVEDLFSEGPLNLSMLKEIADSVSPEEKEAIAMFVANKSN